MANVHQGKVFISNVGVRSSSHDLFEELFIIFLISFFFDAVSKQIRLFSMLTCSVSTSPGLRTNFDFI